MKTRCLFLILAGFVTLSSKISLAQTAIPDNMGKPATTGFAYAEGSPFFADEWNKGDVSLANGTTFKDVSLKFNDLDNTLYYKSGSGKDMIFTEPVHEFTLIITKKDTARKHLFRNGYAQNNMPEAFYEVMSDGKVPLLKIDLKLSQESQNLDSPPIHRIVESVQYYLLLDNRLVPMKKDRKFIFQHIGNKVAEMQAFITANNIDVKNDDDLIKLLNYYNSI